MPIAVDPLGVFLLEVCTLTERCLGVGRGRVIRSLAAQRALGVEGTTIWRGSLTVPGVGGGSLIGLRALGREIRA